MIEDTTTFFLSFTGSLAFIAWYLWRLESKVNAMQRRLDDIRATTQKKADREDGS